MDHEHDRSDDGGYIGRLNRAFETIGGWSYDHRRLVLALCSAVLLLCLTASTGARFDNSFEAYFDRDDPLYAAYLEYRDDFGSDEVSYIVYDVPNRKYGPWDLGVMRRIANLTRQLEEEVPFVDKVTSLANVEFIEGNDEGIRIYRLLEDMPETQAELLDIREKVLAKPLYMNALVSRDGRQAAIIVEMEKSSIDPLREIQVDPRQGNELANLYPQATYNSIQAILARPEYAGIVFYHTGDVPLNAVFNMVTASESWTLGAICFTFIAILLFAFFRRPIGFIGPLAVVALAVVVTLGFVGLLGWKLDLMFSMVPTLLVAVGVADSVHIVSEFNAQFARLGDRRAAVRRTMYLVGTPCLLTSLTTATGFAAMSVAPIKAISHFAAYSAVGVMAAFLLSITLLMTFLSLGGDAAPTDKERDYSLAKGGRAVAAMFQLVASFVIRHRRGIVLWSLALFLVSAAGIVRLTVDSNFLSDFSDDLPVRRATLYVDEHLGGTSSLIYVFDTGTPDGIKDPAVLREIAGLQAEAEKDTDLVRKTSSIVDVLKDLNQAFHGNDSTYRVLPDSRELVAQYLLLYEMSGGEELEEYVSGDFSRATLELRCKTVETSRFAELAAKLQSYLETRPPRLSSPRMTGIAALWIELMDYITRSQIRGFLLAFTVIAAMMCFIFRSVRTGLLSMLPNLAPVALTLGGMGWCGIPLDYTRLLIGTVAIGIAVDDTIHLVSRYRHEFQRCGRYQEALYAALAEVGRALFITSAVLVVGFLVFLFSAMDSQKSFGILLASTILVALAADLLLMPALILVFRPFGRETHAGEGRRKGKPVP